MRIIPQPKTFEVPNAPFEDATTVRVGSGWIGYAIEVGGASIIVNGGLVSADYGSLVWVPAVKPEEIG